MTELQHQLMVDFDFLQRERERLTLRIQELGLTMVGTLPIKTDDPVLVDRHYGWVLKIRPRTNMGLQCIELLYNIPSPRGERSSRFRTAQMTIDQLAERVLPWDGRTFDPALKPYMEDDSDGTT
jgi:hypothetical protein